MLLPNITVSWATYAEVQLLTLPSKHQQNVALAKSLPDADAYSWYAVALGLAMLNI